jgi:hypothetical protein
MKREMLELSFSCDEDLDAMERRDGAHHCARCAHAVHDLSAMTERQADAFLEAHEGEHLCVHYRYNDAGDVLFAMERARQRGMLGAAQAALLAAPLLFAACDAEAPEPSAQAPLVIQDGQPVTIGAAAAPQAPAEPACDEDQELERWRAELAAKQAERDAKRAALMERPISDPPKTREGIYRSSGHVMGRMKRTTVRKKPSHEGIIVDTSPNR